MHDANAERETRARIQLALLTSSPSQESFKIGQDIPADHQLFSQELQLIPGWRTTCQKGHQVVP